MTPGRRVLQEVVLTTGHEPTGAWTHTSDGEVLPKPAKLQIAQFDNPNEVYLLYLDATGAEQTDTSHLSIEEAHEQARLEFGVTPSEWSAVQR